MAYGLFTLPDACRYGHPWGPGAVNISWVTCGCAGGRGHHRVRCMTEAARRSGTARRTSRAPSLAATTRGQPAENRADRSQSGTKRGQTASSAAPACRRTLGYQLLSGEGCRRMSPLSSHRISASSVNRTTYVAVS
jgi:hypothetical protein